MPMSFYCNLMLLVLQLVPSSHVSDFLFYFCLGAVGC
jgi:hypothetical protein